MLVHLALCWRQYCRHDMDKLRDKWKLFFLPGKKNQTLQKNKCEHETIHEFATFEEMYPGTCISKTIDRTFCTGTQYK